MNMNGVMKIAGLGLLFLGLAGAAFGIETPEIDVVGYERADSAVRDIAGHQEPPVETNC